MWFPLCEYDYAAWQTAEGRMQGQVQTNREEVMHNEEKDRPLVPPKRTSMLTGTRFEQFRQNTKKQNKNIAGSRRLHQRESVFMNWCPRAGKWKLQQDVLSGFEFSWHVAQICCSNCCLVSAAHQFNRLQTERLYRYQQYEVDKTWENIHLTAASQIFFFFSNIDWWVYTKCGRWYLVVLIVHPFVMYNTRFPQTQHYSKVIFGLDLFHMGKLGWL